MVCACADLSLVSSCVAFTAWSKVLEQAETSAHKLTKMAPVILIFSKYVKLKGIQRFIR